MCGKIVSDPNHTFDLPHSSTLSNISTEHTAKTHFVKLTVNAASATPMTDHVVAGERFNCAESNINRLASGPYHFVDKTLTIIHFLAGPTHQLILRPRRCGKSHAISMLKTFFESPSPNVPRPATLEAPFKGTLIDGEAYKAIVQEHYKAYPILYMNLKDLNGRTLNEMLLDFHMDLRSTMHDCRSGLRKKYLEDTPLCIALSRLIDKQEEWRNELKIAPYLITQALYTIYDRPVIVLVDEYEAPLNHALQHGYISAASNFFGNMFSRLLKDNLYVEKSFMVGILKLAKSGWLSGLNNLTVYSLNSEDTIYGDSFLFTEGEVQEFLLKTNSPIQLSDLKDFYNSYCAKGSDGKLISLFNPWSVHNAIAGGRLAFYWNNTSSHMPLRKAIWKPESEVTSRLASLLAGQVVQLPMNDMVTYEDLDNLEEKDLWGLLFYAGYLTPTWLEGRFSTYYRIPNVELRREWVTWLREFVEGKQKGAPENIIALLAPLLNGDAAQTQKALSQILVDHFSYFLFDPSLPEKVYQAFLFGLLLSQFGMIPRSYVVDIEKEAGYGRYDIRCWPTLQKHQTEIIIELKAVPLTKKKRNGSRIKRTKEELRKHMDEQLEITMEQLESRGYYRKSRNNITTIHEFGICFAGKLCVARSRTRKRDGTAWNIENHVSPGAQFQGSDIAKQRFDSDVEEKLEEQEKRDKLENHGQNEDRDVEQNSNPLSHHAATGIESAATALVKKRTTNQRDDYDGEPPNMRRSSTNKRRRRDF